MRSSGVAGLLSKVKPERCPKLVRLELQGETQYSTVVVHCLDLTLAATAVVGGTAPLAQATALV